MRLLLLGATGGIGVELTRQAIERGHTITAFVRKAEPLKPFAGQIAVATGNLLDAVELARVMRDQDAVLSAFGPRVPIAPGDAHLLRDFASSLTKAMQNGNVCRGIVISTAFLFKDAMLPPVHFLGRLLFPGVVKDATDMESILSSSKLDILIVRPPQLKDRPRTGKYRVREGHLPRLGLSISRADVADFMIRTAESGGFRNSVIGVSK